MKNTTLDTKYWIQRFARNKLNRPEPDWDAPIDIPDHVRPALIKSLQEFQLGDGGGPASLIAFNADAFRLSSEDMRQIVALWFKEEEEHSRLLGGMLDRLGVESIKGHWSFSLFCGLRHWLGVAFELQILTITELVSTSYYTLLRRHSTDPALRAVCSLILRDESGHVRFHNDRLAAAGRSRLTWLGRLWSLQFWLCGFAAGTVLWISHGRCIRRLGGSTREFYANIEHQIGRFLLTLDQKAASSAHPEKNSAKEPLVEQSS